MYSFFGKTELKIDVKGRVFIPSHYRKQLLEKGDERLVLRKNEGGDFLDLYTESVWEQEIDLVESKLNLFDDDDYLFYMQYTSSADLLEMDASGRILIPKKYLEKIRLESEVMLLGVARKIALWNKESYSQSMISDVDFARLKKQKLGGKLK